MCIPVTVQQQVQLQIQGKIMSMYIKCCIHNNYKFIQFSIDHIPQGQEESLYNNIPDSQFNVVDKNFMVTDQSGELASVEHTISVFRFFFNKIMM